MDDKIKQKDKEISLLINHCQKLQHTQEDYNMIFNHLNQVVDENLILCQNLKKLEEHIDELDYKLLESELQLNQLQNTMYNKDNDMKELQTNVDNKDNKIKELQTNINNINNLLKQIVTDKDE